MTADCGSTKTKERAGGWAATRTPRRAILFALTALVLVGAWLRLRDLGALGLVVDEGYQALAVEGILREGVPRVDSGRLYTRGLPFLYLEAAVARVVGLNELALRLPAAVFGILTILAAYLLAGAVCGWRVGLFAATLLTFSTWEIELARYARFYTAFQCFYLLALWCFFRGFLRDERRYRWWFVPAALAACSMHELGAMLATCFLIPLFSDACTRRRKWLFGAGAVAMTGLWVGYKQLLRGFDAWSLVPALAEDPPGLAPASMLEGLKAALHLKQFFVPDLRMITALFESQPLQFWTLAALLAAATLYLVVRGVGRPAEGWKALWATALLGAAFLHQFGMVLILGVIYLAFFLRRARDLADPIARVIYAGVGVCLAFWLWRLVGWEVRVPRALFGYPNFWQYFLVWLVKGWPVVTGVLAVGTAWLAVQFIRNREDPEALFLLGALWIPAVFGSFLQNEFYEARYIFHLYPVIVTIVSLLAIGVGRRILQVAPMTTRMGRGARVAALVVGALWLTQDANPVAAWEIGQRTYRSARDPIRGHINWTPYASFHQDQKHPALYVRAHLEPGDLVIALGPPHMIAVNRFYIGRVDYASEEDIRDYQFRLTDGRIIDHVTGSELIRTLPELERVIEAHEGVTVWLLADQRLLTPDNHVVDESVKRYVQTLARHPDAVGLDGRTFAVKVQ